MLFSKRNAAILSNSIERIATALAYIGMVRVATQYPEVPATRAFIEIGYGDLDRKLIATLEGDLAHDEQFLEEAFAEIGEHVVFCLRHRCPYHCFLAFVDGFLNTLLFERLGHFIAERKYHFEALLDTLCFVLRNERHEIPTLRPASKLHADRMILRFRQAPSG